MKLETRRGRLLVTAETEAESKLFDSIFGAAVQDGNDLNTKVYGNVRRQYDHGEHYLSLGRRTEEQRNAVKVASQIINRPSTNPGDDLALLAQKVVKQDEAIERLEAALVASQDPTRDLITANRDTILEMHEEAVRRIQKALKQGAVIGTMNSCVLILMILAALGRFHPMDESWDGWPEGS
jgi:DnaJ-domain-containing protein 1